MFYFFSLSLCLKAISNHWEEFLPQFESPAFVGGHLSPQTTEFGPHRHCIRCVAIQIARLALVDVTLVPHEVVEWLARVDCVLAEH